MRILWGYPQDFLWVCDGYGERNSVHTAALIVHRPQCRLVTDGRTDTKPQLMPSYNVMQVKILGFLVGSIFCRFPPSVVSRTGWLMIQAYHQQRRQLDNKCYSSHHRSIVDIIIDSGEPANLAEAADHHIPTICRHSTAWNSPNINYTAPNYTTQWNGDRWYRPTWSQTNADLPTSCGSFGKFIYRLDADVNCCNECVYKCLCPRAYLQNQPYKLRPILVAVARSFFGGVAMRYFPLFWSRIIFT